MKLLFSISSKGEGYVANVIRDDDGSEFFFGDFDVDVDGSPNWKQDPYGQSETTLQHEGKPINSDVVKGIVLPPECIKASKEMVLGCKAEASYRGVTVPCVVFDVGPHFKLGEGSPAAARPLGINPDPNRGGVDEQEVLYRYWPGIPAVVDGIEYKLQHYGG